MCVPAFLELKPGLSAVIIWTVLLSKVATVQTAQQAASKLLLNNFKEKAFDMGKTPAERGGVNPTGKIHHRAAGALLLAETGV